MATSSEYQRVLAQKLADSLLDPIPRVTPRRVFGTLTLRDKATTVIGMRRAGKTSFLHQIRADRLADGVEATRLPYVNFEDERLAGMEASLLSTLADQYYRQFPECRGKQTVTWCFDEIQAVPGWERFIRRMLDGEKVEIFVTGSSAALLSREIATALRGRAWEIVLHPFSFEESLRHASVPLPKKPGLWSAAERSRIERELVQYLAIGGFPEAQATDTATRHQLLLDYVDVALLRDVIERHGVTNVAGLRWLTRHLLGNAAALFSVEKFFAALKSQGFSISKDTVHQMLAHLEDCFLVRTVWMEARSERQRMVNPRKAYPVDCGLIPVFDRTGRANIGHALETTVLIELERRRASVTYVKTSGGYEVDFLARFPDGSTELIQVVADASAGETATRELRALEEAGRQFPKAGKRILTATQSGLPPHIPTGVTAQPVYEWLLSTTA